MRDVALIGAGYWGKNLARSFEALGRLRAICDSNSATLAGYSKNYPKAVLTTKTAEIFADPKVRAVVIATPPFYHFELAKQALGAGKDLLVEKPLCMNSRQGELLAEEAQRRGAVLMVGHLLHYHPCVRRLKELIDEGVFGSLHYIASHRLNLGSYRTEENALWNFAPHDISLILSLSGQPLPESVRCVGEAFLSKGVADMTMTTLRFGSDIRAHIYVGWLNPFKEQKLVVVGSSAMAVFDDTKPWSQKLLLRRDPVRWENGEPQVNPGKADYLAVEKEEPLLEECHHFLDCCKRRTAPITDGAEGLRVLQVLQAAQMSLDSDGEAKCPLQEHELSRRGAPSYFAKPALERKAQV